MRPAHLLAALLLPMLGAWTGGGHGAAHAADDTVAPAAVTPALRAALDRILPGRAPDEVRPAALPGLVEVRYGPNVLYVSDDGRYVFRGDIIDLPASTNLTEQARRTARVEVLERMGEESMIVFAPRDGEAAHTVTVFTDVDCPYCQRLHQEIAGYTERGIKVRYTAFPRAGLSSPTYDTMVSVWCADDPQQAMTDAKAGRDVSPRQCENPVAAHFDLGRLVGVRGTPTIVLEDGRVVPGYVPAGRLAAMLEEE